MGMSGIGGGICGGICAILGFRFIGWRLIGIGGGVFGCFSEIVNISLKLSWLTPPISTLT